MKKWLLASAGLFCAIAVIIASASSFRHSRVETEDIEEEIIPVRLNDTLSNGMSDIPELLGMDR